MSDTLKNGSHLEKCVTLGKWKNGPHLEKMGQTSKNASNLEKWVALGKMGHTWKNE